MDLTAFFINWIIQIIGLYNRADKIWPHLLKTSFMKNFLILWSVTFTPRKTLIFNWSKSFSSKFPRINSGRKIYYDEQKSRITKLSPVEKSFYSKVASFRPATLLTSIISLLKRRPRYSCFTVKFLPNFSQQLFSRTNLY